MAFVHDMKEHVRRVSAVREVGPADGRGQPNLGYTRIQGALKNVGHRVGRSTIARMLKAHGLPPVPERPTSWRTFLAAHKDAIAGAPTRTTGSIRRRPRLGGLLNDYERPA